MKSKLTLTALAVCISYASFSQTKGTNTVSLGVESLTSTVKNGFESKVKTNSFTLGYGHFIKDNSKIGLDLYYGTNDLEYENMANNRIKNYGLSLSYQHYYPIIKKLYAYAGGSGGYQNAKSNAAENGALETFKTDQYQLEGYGGVTWFVSKRFAFETRLLSASITYSETEQIASNQTTLTAKQTNFRLNTSGAITNLGFKIYILF